MRGESSPRTRRVATFDWVVARVHRPRGYSTRVLPSQEAAEPVAVPENAASMATLLAALLTGCGSLGGELLDVRERPATSLLPQPGDQATEQGIYAETVVVYSISPWMKGQQTSVTDFVGDLPDLARLWPHRFQSVIRLGEPAARESLAQRVHRLRAMARLTAPRGMILTRERNDDPSQSPEAKVSGVLRAAGFARVCRQPLVDHTNLLVYRRLTS